MDFRKIYNLFENDIEMLEETTEAEANIGLLLRELKEKDIDFFYDLDSAIGALVRAYEKQGFKGGFTVAKELML